MNAIDTDGLSARLRERSVRPGSGHLLMARIAGSAQEGDLSEPPNCGGFGRVRHFRIETRAPWPDNPLPIVPAAHRLGTQPDAVMTAQVFQSASCNWRCWYCFVPFNLLSANEHHAGWLTAGDMVDLYLAEPDRPQVIDCSGGQPDLVPEWVPWMMRALRERGMEDSVYLWSDDNLSNDYFWRYLSDADRELVASWDRYGRVCCFKGFDSGSFAFNTKAAPELFDRQFDLFGRLLELGIDLYAYATFTAPAATGLPGSMARFVDRLQDIHPNLPLRLVPLRIETFGVVAPRLREVHIRALDGQEDAVAAWNEQIAARFTEPQRAVPVPLVPLRR
jgi:uncharacterized Fe-S cluster-containing radical SAM superfamily protein